MDKKTQNILIILAILFLLYYFNVYSKKSKKNNGSSSPNQKYRCDAGGCLPCEREHPSCVSQADCEEQCKNQIQLKENINVIGCMDNTQLNYNKNANVPCSSCCQPAVMGCTDPSAINYYSAVSQGWGCTGQDPNNTSCCAYMGTDGNVYYGT